MSKPPPRLYLDHDFEDGAVVGLSPEHAHYLGKVLRLSPGALVLGFNGRDGEWRMEIIDLTRKGGEVVCVQQRRPQIAAPDVTLAFAPTKKGPTEFLVQKATEMGVARLQPMLTARTVDRKASSRWEMIAIEAAEQSERLSIPLIEQLCDLDAVLSAYPEHLLMFADETSLDLEAVAVEGEYPPSTITQLADAPKDQPWLILIGPAGGFTPEERSCLLALERCVPVNLGPRILKAETAAVAALTLWQAVLGDLR